MNKLLLLAFVALAAIAPMSASAANMTTRLSGKILLQVEEKGEAWYVSPDKDGRFYMKNGTSAFHLMRSQGQGISNTDLNKLPIGLIATQGRDSDGDSLTDAFEQSQGTDPFDADSDNDGYSDGTEVLNNYSPLNPRAEKLSYDSELVDRLSGQILLQVESLGEAWYLNPDDGKRYFLGSPADAYQAMRSFGLGITNTDLATIPVLTSDFGGYTTAPAPTQDATGENDSTVDTYQKYVYEPTPNRFVAEGKFSFDADDTVYLHLTGSDAEGILNISKEDLEELASLNPNDLLLEASIFGIDPELLQKVLIQSQSYTITDAVLAPIHYDAEGYDYTSVTVVRGKAFQTDFEDYFFGPEEFIPHRYAKDTKLDQNILIDGQFRGRQRVINYYEQNVTFVYTLVQVDQDTFIIIAMSSQNSDIDKALPRYNEFVDNFTVIK